MLLLFCPSIWRLKNIIVIIVADYADKCFVCLYCVGRCWTYRGTWI